MDTMTKETAGFETYAPGPEADLRILQWWFGMARAGDDLTNTFGEGAKTLSSFFRLVQPGQALLLYVPDEEFGVAAAFLISPFLSQAFITLWIHPERRKSRLRLYRLVMQTYHTILQQYGTILGVTKQQQLLPEHEKIGYKVSGYVPGLFDGRDAWLVTLTLEDFLATTHFEPQRTEH